jgi:hypothetical protein
MRLPAPWARAKAGISMAAKIPMMAMTTSSSINVKATAPRRSHLGGSELANGSQFAIFIAVRFTFTS